MLNEYNYHCDKYDQIEEYDDKNKSQEGTKKCCCVGKEAAGGRKGNKSHPLWSYILLLRATVPIHATEFECHVSTVLFVQQLTILDHCFLLWASVSQDHH